MSVHHERVVTDLETQPLGDLVLELLDAGIHEFRHSPAIKADDMVVVSPLVELENGHSVLEMVPGHEPGGLELRENAIDGREPDVLAGVQQTFVDVLGGHVPGRAALENIEDLHARQGDLESGFAQVLAFHGPSVVRVECTAIMIHQPQDSLPRAAKARRSAFAAALLLALAVTPLAGLQGCVYRMTVQQGNFLDAKQISQLQVGMTRSQVRFLLGTPMLPDAFDTDRWDYLYYLKMGRLKKPEQRRLTVFFEGDKAARIENVGAPVEAPAPTGAPAPAAAAPTPSAAAPAP